MTYLLLLLYVRRRCTYGEKAHKYAYISARCYCCYHRYYRFVIPKRNITPNRKATLLKPLSPQLTTSQPPPGKYVWIRWKKISTDTGCVDAGWRVERTQTLLLAVPNKSEVHDQHVKIRLFSSTYGIWDDILALYLVQPNLKASVFIWHTCFITPPSDTRRNTSCCCCWYERQYEKREKRVPDEQLKLLVLAW